MDCNDIRKDYRARRDLANFYQEQITALNVAPIQAWSIIPLMISISSVLLNIFQGIPLGIKEAIVYFAVLAGLGVSVGSVFVHRREAENIRSRYLEEHAYLFPHLPPIELVGFLLERVKVKHILSPMQINSPNFVSDNS